MNNKPPPGPDIDLLLQTPDSLLQQVFPGYTREELRLLKRSLISPFTKEADMKGKSLKDDLRKKEEAREQKQSKKKYDEALKLLESNEKEMQALLDIKKHGVQTFHISPKLSSGTSEGTVVWLASDWHVGEKVTFGQTNGLNEYNPTIAKERGKKFFQNGLRLTDIFAKDVMVNRIVLALLGDFITGHLHLDAVETNYLPPVEETMFAQDIIASGIQFILDNSSHEILVVCHSGNHGRTSKFAHFGSENGHSLEYFMYHSLAQEFADNPRVQFQIPEGAHSYVDIYGMEVRFLHGHDIKFGGGVGGITIPVNKAISQWDKGKKAYLTCFGHFHQRFDGGNFIANGSMIGYNAFALSIKASPEAPAQQMFVIDKKRGKTIVAPILF